MIQILSIATGGAIGSVMRYAISNGVYALLGRGFPYGTLVVNVVGSLLMGLLFVTLVERLDVTPALRLAILVGFLGAFTTFSTFSIETLNLMQAGEIIKAGINVLVSVVLCIAATWLGFRIGRMW